MSGYANLLYYKQRSLLLSINISPYAHVGCISHSESSNHGHLKMFVTAFAKSPHLSYDP
jgi:hypothetical protein